jgi:hypothetical protein
MVGSAIGGKRLEIAQMACFVFLGYARALRGE